MKSAHLIALCSIIILQCSIIILQCSIIILQCSIIILQCSIIILQCSIIISQCTVQKKHNIYHFCVRKTHVFRQAEHWQQWRMANRKIFPSLHHAVKACRGRVGKLHAFLTTAINKARGVFHASYSLTRTGLRYPRSDIEVLKTHKYATLPVLKTVTSYFIDRINWL